MTDLTTRADRVIKEITGNESLLDKLDTEAARGLLNWANNMAGTLVDRTGELDDPSADLVIMPGMKALRQSMRSIGNWAAGEYVDSASRIQLREKLLENLRIILGEGITLPSIEQIDKVLNQVDDRSQTPHQLILKLRELLEAPR